MGQRSMRAYVRAGGGVCSGLRAGVRQGVATPCPNHLSDQIVQRYVTLCPYASKSCQVRRMYFRLRV